MLSFILISLLIAWILFTIGFTFIGTSFDKAKKLEVLFWNARIKKLSKPPFLWFMKVYENKKYIKSLIFVLVLNFHMHVAMFILGYIKIGIVMIIIQPFMMGVIVGMGDDKTRLYGVITSIFEVTGFVLSCLFGFFGQFHLCWISIIFLLLNAIVEAGGIFLGVEGVPGIEAVKNKLYK